jgi:hypothetical protein
MTLSLTWAAHLRQVDERLSRETMLGAGGEVELVESATRRCEHAIRLAIPNFMAGSASARTTYT